MEKPKTLFLKKGSDAKMNPTGSLLEQTAAFAQKEGIRLYRVAEILDGNLRSVQLCPANVCNDCYSVSKSFTATAAGILIDHGLLRLQESVAAVLEDLVPAPYREFWKTVTIADVLRQTVGIDHGFLDIDTDDIHAFGTDDFLWKVLSEPAPLPPGSRMVYSDSNYYLMSRIVSRRAGMELEPFLQREVFAPLQFQGQAWAKCPHGFSMGATGLFVRTDDMARFGQLYLQDGIWNGRRIFSEAWARLATRPHTRCDNGRTYGYGFWPQEEDAFRCDGMFGQAVIISRRCPRVLAWTAFDAEGKIGTLLQAVDRWNR